MSNAFAAAGTLLKIGDGGGTETFTTVAEVKDISGPSMTTDLVETTNQSSPANTKEWLAVFLDAGEVTFDLNFLPSDSTQSPTAGMLYDYQNLTLRDYQLVLPNTASTTMAFSAFVTAFTPKAPVKDAATASVTLRISGSVTWS